MLVANQTAKSNELFSYVVASGDMRCIDIAERVVFFRNDPRRGLLIHGELPGCEPESEANLSYILIEYAMSCADRREVKFACDAVDQFGLQLGQKVIDFCTLQQSDKPESEVLIDVANIVLNSLDVPFEFEQSSRLLRFRLAHCPIRETANRAGLSLWIALAQRSLIVMFESLVDKLVPGWTLRSPVLGEHDLSIREVLFVRT